MPRVFLWIINSLFSEIVQVRHFKNMYGVDVQTIFQLLYLPSACKAYNRNIYIPATVELTIITLPWLCISIS